LTEYGPGRQGAALRLVPQEERAPTESVPFCGHCGFHPHVDTDSRVCQDCGLGLILEAAPDVAPAVGDAFLVFDNHLAVCAVSAEAEKLLAASEMELVNRHISEVLVPADVEPQSTSKLATALIWAARGDHATRQVLVRPANTFGVRLCAHIARCGPPHAALVVLG
jgi:PAS domain-containing protein